VRTRPVHVVASARTSNESLYLLQRLIATVGGRGVFTCRVEGIEQPLPGVPDLARRPERAPNARGAEALGFARVTDPLAGLAAGDVLLIVDEELDGVDLQRAREASAIVFAGTVLSPALAPDAVIILPLTNMAEDEGTFTNLRGRVQRYLQAKTPPALARPGWFVWSELLTALGAGLDARVPADVFAALAADTPAFSGLSYVSIGLQGGLPATTSGVSV
jgi:NADH-quinone oxidoreductase subunit G